MNFDILDSQYEILVHSLDDNVLKTVKLNKGGRYPDKSYTDLLKDFVSYFNEQLELTTTTIVYVSDYCAEIINKELVTIPGWVYNTQISKDTLLYQIKLVEIHMEYPPRIPTPPPPPPQEEKEQDTQTSEEGYTDFYKFLYESKFFKEYRDSSDEESVSECEPLLKPSIEPVPESFFPRSLPYEFGYGFDVPVLGSEESCSNYDLFHDQPNVSHWKDEFLNELTTKLRSNNLGLTQTGSRLMSPMCLPTTEC